jgi:hypothetical protein
MSGTITKALEEAIDLRQQLLAGGMGVREVDQRIGQSLKAVLGASRAFPWRFYCERCRDTGAVVVEPSADELTRLVRLYGDEPPHAGYVVKCEPCKWIQVEREKRRKKAGEEYDADALEGAGQTKRGFHKLTR